MSLHGRPYASVWGDLFAPAGPGDPCSIRVALGVSGPELVSPNPPRFGEVARFCCLKSRARGDTLIRAGSPATMSQALHAVLGSLIRTCGYTGSDVELALCYSGTCSMVSQADGTTTCSTTTMNRRPGPAGCGRLASRWRDPLDDKRVPQPGWKRRWAASGAH